MSGTLSLSNGLCRRRHRVVARHDIPIRSSLAALQPRQRSRHRQSHSGVPGCIDPTQAAALTRLPWAEHPPRVNSPKLTLALVAGLFVLVVAGFVLQWQTNAALWQSIASQNGSVNPSPTATVANGEARGASATDGTRSPDKVELARLREEVNDLRARTAALARLSVRAAESSSPALNLLPSGAWKNAGRATPSAAAETMMWATDSGNVDALAAAITLDQAAREKAEAILARMSDAVRAMYDTPEKLVALLLARETDIRAMQVLGESSAGDEALVNMRLMKDDGKTKEEGMQFRRTPDGWRANITGKAVDKMGKKLSEPSKKDAGKK